MKADSIPNSSHLLSAYGNLAEALPEIQVRILANPSFGMQL
jgi:hypothetical protein